jgi:hypothetical protein
VSDVTRKLCLVTGLLGMILLVVMAAPALSHHSFAMYDQTTTKTMTGKLTRYVPGANHAQLIFVVVANDGTVVMKDGKPFQWGVETGSAAAMSRLGVAPATFPEGTFFTVKLYPLRDGRNFGALAGMLITCGTAMPKGGCTLETGKRLIGETFNAQ